MKTIAFIVDKDIRNSITGYALSVFNILQTSTKYNYVLVHCPLKRADGEEKFIRWLNGLNADAIIYNWYPSGDNWLWDDMMQFVNKPQFVIGGHEHVPKFDVPKHQWSAWYEAETTDRLTPLPRPVATYPDIKYSPPGDRIKIGSFGLGLKYKQYPKIVEMVNEQFSDVVVDLNFHMSYTPHTFSETNSEAQKCVALAALNVNLNIDFTFLETSHDIVKFLNGNDINVFLYDAGGRVSSSSLDHALSARKPIALSRSSLFSHLHHIPGIWAEERSLRDIMNDGIAPLEQVYQEQSNDRFLSAVEPYLDKYV